MSYLVTSPLVLVKVPEQVGDGYRLDYHYQGAVIPWLSDEQRAHFLAEKLVEEIDGSDESADDGRPKKTARKADWVEYAVVNDYDRDNIEAMNKADIVALFD